MIVLDATVVVKLLVEEPGSKMALERIQIEEDRISPAWLRLEVTNALVKKVGKNELLREVVPALLRSVSAIVIELVDPLPLIGSATELALSAPHAVYDCLYLALAVQRDAILLTHDQGLAKAAGRLQLSHHVELLT